jgi:hypothetical protein
MKVLLAVGGSAHSQRMLAWLAAHDEFPDPQADDTVMTVVAEVPPHARFFDLADPHGVLRGGSGARIRGERRAGALQHARLADPLTAQESV